jgi:hypothetical protein
MEPAQSILTEVYILVRAPGIAAEARL